MNSKFMTVNWRDLGKGCLLAFLTVFAGLVVTTLNEWVNVLGLGQLPTLPSLAQFGQWALIGLSAALAYLVKNLFTNSENKLFSPER